MSEHYWHFLCEDKRLRYGDKRIVSVGETITVDCEPILCEQGLHASKRAIDAVDNAPGPILCRVTLGGKIVHGTDKSSAQERTVLWMADATNTLHEFACWCAENALRVANVTDERCWNAINTKLKWLKGEATDQELAAAMAAARAAASDAAWDAAMAAARDATWAATSDAARDAAMAAAMAAARDAARAAARDAARDAARAAQNEKLEQMFLALEPIKEA